VVGKDLAFISQLGKDRFQNGRDVGLKEFHERCSEKKWK
jgi:hypothetical protein